MENCCYCGQADEMVKIWQLSKYNWFRQSWLPIESTKFYAHSGCLYKEQSANGDGHGVRLTA